MNPAKAQYEAVPYHGSAFPQTHPGHLSALGLLLGVTAAPPERCRVLELGCGQGKNLLPMAQLLPDSHFVGIDLSPGHIAIAQATADAAALRNITLRAQDLLDFQPGDQPFDYIIAHGLFSWVDDRVKERILGLCGEALAEQGIAYISYNCYPGWSQREALCDLLRMRAGSSGRFEDRVSGAWETLNFFDSALSTLTTPYALMMREIIASMRQKDPNVFFHDELGSINDPCYFLQFIEWAAEHRLQYLADATLSTMLYENLPDPVRPALEALRLDHLQTEQFMDFLRDRRFRASLLCRQDHSLPRRIDPAAIRRLRIRSMMTSTDAMDAGATVRFVSPMGHGVSTAEPLTRTFLAYLAAQSPRYVPFAEALTRASDQTGQNDPDALLRLTLDLLTKDLVQVSSLGVDLPAEIPAHPRATALAREQARRDRAAVNLLHELHPLTDHHAAALAKMDGFTPSAAFDPQVLEALRRNAFILLESYFAADSASC